MHRDTLFAIVSDRAPGLFSSPAEVVTLLRRYPEAFPALGDGVYWSEYSDLQKAAREDRSPEAFVSMGHFAWSTLHDPNRTEAMFSRALQMEIDNADGHWGLADLYVHQGRWAEASGVLGWLRWRFPADKKVIALLARCQEKLEKWDLAVDLWKAMVDLSPRDASARLRLGIAAFESEDIELAAEALQSALEIDDDLAGAHLLLARIAFELDDMTEVMGHLRRALELDVGMVAERCPGPLLDAFLATAEDADHWIGQLERQMRYR